MLDFTLNTPSVDSSVDISNINLQGLIDKANTKLPTTNNSINSGFNSAIQPSWQSKGFGKPLEGYDAGLLKPVSGYNKFTENPTYNPEFSPIQNQREYAANQGAGEYAYNLGAKLLSTSWNSFEMNFQQYGRDLSALMKHDSSLLASNQDTNDTSAEDLKYPTMGSGENNNSWLRFVPFTHGSGDFWGSMVPSLGFTVGTMGGAIVENAILAATTEGVGNLLEGANTTRKIGSAIKDLYDTFTGAKAYKRGINLLAGITKEANLGDKLITGAKSMANFYQIYHTAASEASFQASGDYASAKQQAIDNYTKEYGYAPYGKDLDEIEKNSQNAKLSSFIENLAVLIPSNLEQFPNIMRPYSLVDNGEKLAIKGIADDFALGEKATKIVSKNKVIQGIWNFVSKHATLGLDIAAEGGQEISQSVISNFNKDYYGSKLTDKDPMQEGVNSVKDYLFSPNFWNDFMGGALGGAIFHGVGSIRDLITGEGKEREEQKNKSIEDINKQTPFTIMRGVANRIFSPDVSNLNTQQFNSQKLNDAYKTDDVLGYKDTQDNSFREFLWTRAATGKYNLGLEQLELMKHLEGDDFKRAFGVEYDSENAKVATDLVDKLIDRAKQFESDYIAVTRYYSNPYNPNKFSDGSPEQLTELVKKTAFDNTVRDRIFSRDIVQRDRERQSSIFDNLESDTKNVVNRTTLQNFFVDNKRKEFLEGLKQLNKSYEDATDKTLIEKDYQDNKDRLNKAIAITNLLDNDLDKEGIKDIASKVLDYSEAITPGKDYDRQSVINNIADSLHLEKRNKANIDAYNALQTKAGFEKYLDNHQEAIAEVLSQWNKKNKDINPIEEEKDKEEEPELTSADIEVRAKSAGIVIGNPYTLGKDESLTTNRKIDGKVYPYNTDEEIQSFYTALNEAIANKSVPKESDVDPADMNPSEVDDLYKSEATKNKVFQEASRKPISSIAFTDTAPKFEDTDKNDPTMRKEFMLNNLFFKKGNFGKRTDLNLVVIPVTAFNYKEVGEKVGADLQYLIDQANSLKIPTNLTDYRNSLTEYFANEEGKENILKDIDNRIEELQKSGKSDTEIIESLGTIQELNISKNYSLSKDNLGGHVNLIYANQKGNDLVLIDQNGDDITENHKDKIVQGRLTDLTTDTYPSGDSRFDADVDEAQKKAAIANNIAVRKSLIDNTDVKPYNFIFSDGRPNNQLSKDSVAFQQTSIKDAGLDNKNNSIIIPDVTNGNSRVEGSQLLIKGRPYLKIEGQDEKGNSRTFYQYLDNTNLTTEQKTALNKAVDDYKAAIKEDYDLNNQLKKETDKDKKIEIRDKINDLKEGRDKAFTYLSGLLNIVDYEIKNQPSHKYKVRVREKDGNVRFSYLTGIGDKTAITNSDNIQSFIEDKYHRVNRSLLSKEFTDYVTGKTFSTYEDYLLNSENPPLTVRMNSVDSGILPYVQRYSTVDFNNIKGIVAIPTNPKAKIKIVETKNDEQPKTTKSNNKKTSQERLAALKKAQLEEDIIKNNAVENDDLSDIFNGNNHIEEFANPSKNNNTEQELPKITKPYSKKTPQEKLKALVNAQAAEDNIISKKNKAKPKENKNKVIKGERIKDRLADEINDIKLPFNPDDINLFQVERTNYNNQPITDNDLSEFRKILSQVDFKYNPELERYFKGRKVWGSFKGNVAQLYNGASKGTLYHEAFEAVYNSILTKSQQQGLLSEFRKREGTFSTFNNEEKSYALSTDLEAKEKIADEFFDWRENQGDVPHKNFFQKLWGFVKNFFNKIIVRTGLGSPAITDVYNNITSGVYNGIPLRSSFDEYFKVGDASEREMFESIQSTTGLAFKKIAESANVSDANNEGLYTILKALEEGTQKTEKLYDYIKKTLTDFYTGTTPDFKAAYKTRIAQIMATGVDKATAIEQGKQEAKRAIALFNTDILGNWDSYVQAHQNMMSGLGISFDNSKVDEDEKGIREKGEDKDSNYINEDRYLKFDNFRSISASVKLFVAALTDGQFENIDGEAQVVSTISPFTLQPLLIENSKLFFNRLVNTLANINDIEGIRKKLQDYTVLNRDAQGNLTDDRVSRNIKANVKTLLDRVFTKDVDKLSPSEISLRLKFLSSFSKQMPDFQRFKVDSNNNVRFVNELYETNVKAMLKSAYGRIFKTYWKDSANSWIKYNKGDITIGGSNSPKPVNVNRTNISSLSSGLSKLGLNYSEDRLKTFSPTQFKSVVQNYNDIASVLSEEQTYVKEEGKKQNSKTVIQKHIGSRLNNLAESLLEGTLDETDPMHFGPDGQATNNYADNNALSLILSEVNNSQNLSEFKDNNPQYNDTYCDHSLLLNEKLFSDKNRTWRLNILSGVEITSDEKKNKKAINTSKPELFIARFNASLQTPNRDAIYSMYENADGSIDWALQAGEYLNLGKKTKVKDTYFNYLIDEVNFALDFARNKDSKRRNYEELNKSYDYASEKGTTQRLKGKSLQFFSAILSPRQLDNIHFQIDNNQGSAEELLSNAGIVPEVVYKQLRKFIDNQYEIEKEYLKGENFLSEEGNGYKLYLLDSSLDQNILSEGDLSTLMENRILNYMTHNIELSKVFFGAPSYYGDPLKRFKSFMSPRLSTLRDKEGSYNKWFNKNLNKTTDGNQIDKNDLTYHEFSENMNFVSVDDIRTKNALESVFDNFGENESTDAQMYMMLNAARELYWKSGANWTTVQEEQYQLEKAYERLQLEKKGFYIYSDKNLKREDSDLIKPYWQGDRAILPAKGFVTVIKPIGTGTKTDGLFSPNLLKTSAAPLSWSMVEDTLMEPVYIDMLNYNIHALTYKSAHKVGQLVRDGKVPSIIGENGEVNLPSDIADIESIPWHTFGIQVETQSQKDRATIGTQLMKLITLDTSEHGVPIDYTSKGKSPYTRLKEWSALSEDEKRTASPLYKKISRHDNALRNLNTVNYYAFLDKFGVTEQKDDQGAVTGFNYPDKTAFKKVIEKSLISQSVPQHILDQLNYDPKTGTIPLEMMAEYQLIQHIIYSTIDRNVLSFKVNGGQKIQMSSLLLDRAAKEGYTVEKDKNGKLFVTNPGLKFYEKGKDGTTRMEVMLSYRIFSDINSRRVTKRDSEGNFLKPLSRDEMVKYLKDNAPKLLQGIGFRIPTQAVSSIDTFEIKGFLPEYLGDVIAVPSELPTKAGSDFDVDKLNTYLSNYRVDHTGLPSYIPSFANIEQARAYFSQDFEDNLARAVNKVAEKLEQEEDKTTATLGQALKNAGLMGELSNDEIDNLAEKLDTLTNREIQDQIKDRLVKNNIKKSAENEYFESIANLVLDENRFNKLISPNNTEPFTKKGGHVDQVLDLKGKQNLGNKLNYGSLLSFSDMIDNRNNNAESKKDVGIGAVGVTSHANFQRLLAFVKFNKDNNVLHEGTAEDYIKFPHNKVTIKGKTYLSLSAISKSDGENISEFLSMYINGTVDVSRNPWLKKYGAYAQAFPVAIMAEKAGMNSSDIKLMINHPAVKEYMRIQALKRSPVYNVNPSLQEKYGSLFTDEQYFDKFVNDIKGSKDLEKKSFTSKDIKIIEKQISDAGENENYIKFLDGLKNQAERDIAISTLKQFLLFKEIGQEVRQNVSASNHETVYLNSNAIMPVKESNLAKVNNGIIKAYSGGNIISASQAIRDNTFVGKWINNLKKIEEFIYGNVNSEHTKGLLNFLIRKISKNSEKEVNVDDAIDTVKKFETVMYSSIIQDALHSDNPNYFSIDNPDFEFLTSEKDRADGVDKITRINEGLGVFDYLSPIPMGESNHWYIVTKNKPSNSDIMSSNVFNEAFRNMKVNNPRLYNALMKATVLQSGTQFIKNSFTSFIQPDNYFNLSDKVNDIKITAVYMDMLSTLFAQNNYKSSNGIVRRVDRGTWLGIPINISKKAEIKNIPIKSGVNKSEKIFPSNSIIAYPKEYFDNKKTKTWKKSGFVDNDFISWNTGLGDNLKWNLIKKVGEFTKNFDRTPFGGSKEMTYSVYIPIPVRGTNVHLETWSPTSGDPFSYNSEFNTNEAFPVISNDEILSKIAELGIDNFVPKFEEDTSILDDQDIYFDEENNVENYNSEDVDNQEDSVALPTVKENTDINFVEHNSTNYAERTKENASADITLAFASDFNSGGEKATRREVTAQKKIYHPIDMSKGLDYTMDEIHSIVDKIKALGKDNITINVAGNGIYTFKGQYTQSELDDWIRDYIDEITYDLKEAGIKANIVSGGQTGADEAGAKAGVALGLPTTVRAPKGWKFRDINGNDISDENQFKDRFNNTESSNDNELISKLGIPEEDWNNTSEEEKQKIRDCNG